MSTWSQFRVDASRHVSRKAGGSTIASAAYRAGERLYDEREQQAADYSGRYGVVANGLTMPEGGGPAWTREQLWNAAEAAEGRKDARTARKIEVALPDAMTPEQRRELVQEWAAELANRYGVAVDWAIHLPDRKGDARNHHAHLMLTTREITAEGLGGKAVLELSNTAQKARGLPVGDQAMQELRQVLADRFNQVVERQGLDLQADPRNYQERGIELVPTRHIGVAATGMDRRQVEAERVQDHEATRALNAEKIAQRPEIILETLTGRDAVFTRRDMARELHRYIDAPEQFAAVMARLDASPELVRLSPGGGENTAQLSTREMVRTEGEMAEAAGAMAHARTHQVAPGRLHAVLDRHGHLSAEQRAAVEHVTAPGQLAAVVGSAGAGKSRSLAAAREAWEAQGFRVLGAALAGKAAEELQGSAGMRSRTLAALEYAWRVGREELTARDVLVVDEAGMVGSRQMGRVLAEARRTGAKVVLVGDERQLQPIEAGAAFRAVVERVGAAEIREVRRQTRHQWAREASQAFARGNVGEGLAAYAGRGHVRMEDSREAAKAAIARDFVAGEGGSRLILAHTNRDVRDLNEAVRAERQRRGELAQGAEFGTARGLRGFASGDRLVFLANDRELGVKNGTLGTVEQAEPGRLAVRLDGSDGEGRRVVVQQAEYDQVDHGYAVTVHKSQGATVDRAYVLASGGMDSHLAYVSMSRHRDEATLYAGRDDFATERMLTARLSRSRPKASTLDFAERRGIETPLAWIEDARAVLERGRERLGAMWERAGRAFELVREHVAQLRPERPAAEGRREELREALGLSRTAESTAPGSKATPDARDADAGSRGEELRRALGPEQAPPASRPDRDALRAALFREGGPAPLTRDELRQAVREPEKPIPERERGREQGRDRGQELER